jgi:hypothetical protein
MQANRERVALEVWEDEGGTCCTAADVDRSPPMSWFARIYGAQHHLGALGPARTPAAALHPSDPDADSPLICRARD